MCSSSCPQKSRISSCHWIYEGILMPTLAGHHATGKVLHREEKIIFLDASYIYSSPYLGNPR